MDDSDIFITGSPMSYQNNIEDHGSTKLALSTFANAHSMAFFRNGSTPQIHDF